MVKSDPPYIYLPNGEPAKHKDDKDYNMAKEWGLSRGRKLQLRDYLAVNRNEQLTEEDDLVQTPPDETPHDNQEQPTGQKPQQVSSIETPI